MNIRDIAFSLFGCAAACILAPAAFVVTNANGQVKPEATVTVITPPPITLQAAGIKGTIKVPAPATSGPFVGFGCANLLVYAESKGQKTKVIPGGPGEPSLTLSFPIWTKYTTATGTYSAGTCSYTLVVPASPHEFTMHVGITSFMANIPGCGFLDAEATGLGGLLTVPKATWKTNDFSVTKLDCVEIH